MRQKCIFSKKALDRFLSFVYLADTSVVHPGSPGPHWAWRGRCETRRQKPRRYGN